MEALTLGLLLLVAVLASSLIDQIIPRVSLPLIQIVIGLLIAVVAGGEVEVTLDPELFLVMFIAPLLYDEAKHADKQALWRERKPVLSLAIGLVVATTLVIGLQFTMTPLNTWGSCPPFRWRRPSPWARPWAPPTPWRSRRFRSRWTSRSARPPC